MTNRFAGRVVRTAADLYQLWDELFRIEGVRERALYLIFFDDEDRMLPVVTPIDDLPVVPDRRVIAGLGHVVAGLAEQGVRSVAMAIARPGSRHMSALDREWARALVGVDPTGRRPIHLATPDELYVFAADDLMVA